MSGSLAPSQAMNRFEENLDDLTEKSETKDAEIQRLRMLLEEERSAAVSARRKIVELERSAAAGAKLSSDSIHAIAREVWYERQRWGFSHKISTRAKKWLPRVKRASTNDEVLSLRSREKASLSWHPHFGEIGGLRLEDWLDRLPPSPPIRLSIVITGEERTGSEWLCQLLVATGLLGRPSEYFNSEWFQKFIPDYPDDVEGEIRVAHRAGVSPNGIFSIKLHPWHFDKIVNSGGKLTDVVPNVVFVRLSRKDRLGQAISMMRARQTGRFHEYWHSARSEQYDANELEGVLAEIISSSARWTRYFARNGIEPLQIYYEDFCTNPVGTVQQIGRLAGVDIEDLAIDRELRPQRDGVSVAWRRQFLDDAGDLNRFD